MEFDKEELIHQLKMEILVLERGGYQPSVHSPHVQPRYVLDSVGCLNFALGRKEEPCSLCAWIAFVPPEHSEKEDPCLYIPLNEAGDTIASLYAAGKRGKVEELWLAWLRSTLALLEGN